MPRLFSLGQHSALETVNNRLPDDRLMALSCAACVFPFLLRHVYAGEAAKFGHHFERAERQGPR